MIEPILICVQMHYLVERCNQVQKYVLHDYLFVLWLSLCIGHYSFFHWWIWYLSYQNNRCPNHHAASSHLSSNCWHCLFSYVMKIILEPTRTIQAESFTSENSTLLHFFFQCILSFEKRKRFALCFVVNEGCFFNFSLLISWQHCRTRRTLALTLALTLDFFHYLFHC